VDDETNFVELCRLGRDNHTTADYIIAWNIRSHESKSVNFKPHPLVSDLNGKPSKVPSYNSATRNETVDKSEWVEQHLHYIPFHETLMNIS
jgi:hypothetical protein